MAGRVLGGVLAAATLLGLVACTGGRPGAPHANSSSASSSSLVATRWWSNAAATSGSTIDAKQPLAAAARLHASRSEYCGMLRQTVGAGKSILPGVTVNDPALLTTTRAFIGEIQAVAPSSVAASWRVVGRIVLALVTSLGDAPKVSAIHATGLRQAADAIATDAASRCHVNVSA
jgi:hypothetical protein